MNFLIAVMLSKAILASTFAAAGVAKLFDRTATREMLSAFGVPAHLAPSLAIMLPLAEIATATGLIVPTVACAAGIAAALLLFSFTAAIAYNLSAGRRPSCNCFGQIQAAPIGAWTLVRNGLLCVPAFVIVAAGPGRAGAWSTLGASPLEIVVVALGTVCAASLGLNIVLMMRLNGRQEGLHDLNSPKPVVPAMTFGLMPGATAPGFRLKNQSGTTVSLDDLLSAGKPLVLIFTSSSCPACAALGREIAIWRDRYGDRLVFAKICEGAPATDLHAELSLLQTRREIADAYQCWGTPGAVLVQRDGTIASSVAQGTSDIRALIEEAAQLASDPQPATSTVPVIKRGLDIGEIAPTLTFTDQHGRALALSDYVGREVVLVFWNPDCGFCQKMFPALRQRDRSRKQDGPALVIISMATADRNRLLGLSSPVVHDAGSKAMSAFGVRGTPAAVLIDARGIVASGRAAGADSVMSLVRGSTLVREIADASS